MEISKQDDVEQQHALYELIAKTNEALRIIHPEIMLIHKTARDLFQSRFPELESIVLKPVDYARVVLAIGNSERVDNLNGKLGWLSSTEVMSVTVAFSASPGGRLSRQEFADVERACMEIVFLDQQRQLLLTFLERRMHIIAPNTMALVGASICAKLISAAGSITELSRTPAGNIQVLGS